MWTIYMLRTLASAASPFSETLRAGVFVCNACEIHMRVPSGSWMIAKYMAGRFLGDLSGGDSGAKLTAEVIKQSNSA